MGDEVIGARPRLRRRVTTTVVAAIAATALTGTPASAEPAQVPCDPIGGGKHECSWWRAGDGRSSGAIVVRDGKVVGYLHQGRNWITCQQEGAAVHNEDGNRNRWYGWTLSDYGGWGWASALDAKGGDDYGKFDGVPSCDGDHGAAPGVAGLWSTRPPQSGTFTPIRDDEGGSPVTSCSSLHQRQQATARFSGHVHSARPVWQLGGRRVRIGQRERVNDRFTIGSVTIEGPTCKQDGRWKVLGPSLRVARVTSVGLTERGGKVANRRPRNRAGYGHGWGVTAKTYRYGTDTLVLRVAQCGPSGRAQLGGPLELVSFPLFSVGKLMDLGLWIASRLVPADDMDCIRLGEYDFAVRATATGRLRLRLVAQRGAREGIAKQKTVAAHNNFSVLRRYEAQIVTSPGPSWGPRRIRPGRQP